MEISKQLNCPVTYVYNEIMNSVVYDIKRSTGARVKKDFLKDYTYTKQFHDGSTGTIKILEQVKNERYMFQTITNKNTFTSAYRFTAIDDHHCQIDYKEVFESNGMLQKVNDLLMRILFQHSKKAQFLQMLEQIEEKYQSEQIKADVDRLKNHQ